MFRLNRDRGVYRIQSGVHTSVSESGSTTVISCSVLWSSREDKIPDCSASSSPMSVRISAAGKRFFFRMYYNIMLVPVLLKIVGSHAMISVGLREGISYAAATGWCDSHKYTMPTSLSEAT